VLPTKFTIRVYGILINDKKEVLIAEEIIHGRPVTKFPGGGLELGEGTKECVQREFREETGQEVSVAEHFYTTDFYIQSQINPEYQVMCIYYIVRCKTSALIEVNTPKDNITLRWVALTDLHEDIVSFESDKTVVRMLLKQFK